MAHALTSALLAGAGFRHGFFTRRGGVSEGPYASLNVAASSGDEPGRVGENLRRCAEAVGVGPGRLFFLSQVHGVRARAVGPGDEPGPVAREEGDIVLSAEPGFACAVRSADCVPVLLADRHTGAVCAVHSGWRGVELDAAGAGARALGELAGPGADLIAAVGPHISADAFEVGDEVAGRLEAISPAPGVVRRRPGERPRVDLRAIVTAQLLRAGVRAIDHVGGCTVAEPDLFFSYRRDGAASGRLLSALVARPPGRPP
ncbi:MAG TPA: polyphenol oxidase family protein [Polyangiaceae bacterium]|nr:polyphenol oxidase family protein [Polyangiaceae bacterium]